MQKTTKGYMVRSIYVGYKAIINIEKFIEEHNSFSSNNSTSTQLIK
jgi:hypothetical protein